MSKKIPVDWKFRFTVKLLTPIRESFLRHFFVKVVFQAQIFRNKLNKSPIKKLRFLKLHTYIFRPLMIYRLKDPNSKNVHIFVTPSSLVWQIFDKIFSITVIISTRWSNGFFNWQIMTHFSQPGKKYNRSSLISHEKNSRHKKRAPERHVHFYYSNPLL